MKKRGVIFDYDGVVVDSWTTQIAYWCKAMADYGVDDIELAVQQRMIGLSALSSAETLVNEYKLDVPPLELAEKRRAHWMADGIPQKIKAMPGIREAFARLSDFPMAIAALRPRPSVELTLKSNQLDFPGIITAENAIADNFSQSDVLEQAVKELELTPANCVAIDDSRNGILAAKRVGLSVIAFDSNPTHNIDFSMADGQITSLDELIPELINQVIST